jgi:hypothetical protein
MYWPSHEEEDTPVLFVQSTKQMVSEKQEKQRKEQRQGAETRS